jgi:hypothetical protein
MFAPLPMLNHSFESPVEDNHSFARLSGRMYQGKQKVPFSTINFTYMPTIANGWKTLWVDLKFPTNLRIGAHVNIEIRGEKIPRVFEVLDLIGTRVVLSPIGFSYYGHYPQDYWGYTTKNSDPLNPARSRDWIYGSGKASGYLIF